MSYETLLYTTEGPIGVITLNRPERRNALSLELMQELIDCLDRVARDSNVRAVILAAAGKVFSSGHDLSQMVGRTISDYRKMFDVCVDLMTKLQTIPQPVIAEVQGIATAAGCQLVESSTASALVTPSRLWRGIPPNVWRPISECPWQAGF